MVNKFNVVKYVIETSTTVQDRIMYTALGISGVTIITVLISWA